MTDEDLRARLMRLDPARRLDVAAQIESRTPAEIRERAMETIDNDGQATGDQPRPLLAILTVAATLAVVVGGAVLAARPDSGSAPPAVATADVMKLHVPSSDVMASCVQFDVAFLREMPVAFSGTVTAVEADHVSLTVDHWYKGGSAGGVTVETLGGEHAVALDGVEFVQGKRYYVTATDGVVNGCGFSGESSAELQAAYDEAFGS